MTQATDSDIKDLTSLILGIDKKIDEVRSDLRIMDARLIEVEKKVDKLDGRFDKLDNRLWLFAMLILGSALTAIIKLFGVPTV